MRKEDVVRARDNYKYLKEQNENIIKLKEQFKSLEKDRMVSEYLNLKFKDDVHSRSRLLELLQLDSVKNYIYLFEKYNGFSMMDDNDMIEASFDFLVNDYNNDCNVYVYIATYKFDNYDDGEYRTSYNDLDYDYRLYKNIETGEEVEVLYDEDISFCKKNKIIKFKHKCYNYLELYYNLRIMYLRQYLLDDKCKLFKNNKLKVLKKKESSKFMGPKLK